ncbi:hypothetical protein ZIOFF_049600 [Zingiber officinale]|uniref:Retrovirus-related Pol polyprotein from transposon RE1 n=1 Tax=Zingiber officinale TaxID=94328 RepID=A0A8J5KQT2_ZINOF|nr:hypothetical protein ZIOFF_049600 [Zingiber officinale]
MAFENNFVQPAIPRFDGHYDHWSMLMENFLRSKEYWTVVISGVAESIEGVALTDAQLKDLKAKNYLFQAIDRSILETILCKNTAKDIWDSMKKKYQGTTRAKRQQLQALRSEQNGDQTNFAEEEEVSLLMVCHEKEKTQRHVWYLDTGCSNHMSGEKDTFSDLDETFRSSVKFGDNSTISVMGKGKLQEKGYEIAIKEGVCRIQDAKLGLIAQEFKKSMMVEFEMSDLGMMHYFLGMEVVQSTKGIFISQKKYVQEILDRFQMKDCNPVSTPTEFGLKLNKDHEGKKVDSTIYKQIVGSLMYLTATRPDIMYSVSLISRYMENPTEIHLLAAKRILRYLQGTKDFGLFYKKGAAGRSSCHKSVVDTAKKPLVPSVSNRWTEKGWPDDESRAQKVRLGLGSFMQKVRFLLCEAAGRDSGCRR